jgi:hypothetical protein
MHNKLLKFLFNSLFVIIIIAPAILFGNTEYRHIVLFIYLILGSIWMLVDNLWIKNKN